MFTFTWTKWYILLFSLLFHFPFSLLPIFCFSAVLPVICGFKCNLLQISVLLNNKLCINSAKYNDTKFCFIHFCVYLGFQFLWLLLNVTILTWEDCFYFLTPYVHLLDNWYLNLLKTPFPHHLGTKNGAMHSNI